VDILDSATLQRLQSLASPWETLACDPLLVFSPDSRRLTYSGRNARRDKHHGPYLLIEREVFIVTWDLQTGGLISAIEWNKLKSGESDGEDSGSEGPESEEWVTEDSGSEDSNSKESCSEESGSEESGSEESGSEESGSEESDSDGLEGITYSTDGRMVALLSRLEFGKAIIDIFDVVSGVYMHYLDCPPLEDSRLCQIWTHEGFIRFVTAESTGITIWEVGFTLGATPTEVKTLPAPKNVNDAVRFEFLPTSYRALFVYSNQVLIWDARNSQSLLHHADTDDDPVMTLSPDGHFFACPNAGSGIDLWKESPTGYIPHGKFSPSNNHPRVLFSQNGESIITFEFEYSMVQLWQTSSSISTPSSTSVQTPQQNNFILDFHPDMSLAVLVRQEDSMVVVLDLKSGTPWLTIETSMEVYGLGVIKNTIAAIGCKKIITWNLPERNHLLDVKLNTEDSTQTVHLRNHPRGVSRKLVTAASMSHDSCYIALLMDMEGKYMYGGCLCFYSASTGKYLGRISTRQVGVLWFTPAGNEIWCAGDENKADVWTITGNNLDYTMVVTKIEDRSWGCPWGSSQGYQITNEGWILGLDGRRLLMLPPSWQADAAQRVWKGKFLALLHATLPEPVIWNASVLLANTVRLDRVDNGLVARKKDV
jgi:hypothetical protein